MATSAYLSQERSNSVEPDDPLKLWAKEQAAQKSLEILAREKWGFRLGVLGSAVVFAGLAWPFAQTSMLAWLLLLVLFAKFVQTYAERYLARARTNMTVYRRLHLASAACSLGTGAAPSLFLSYFPAMPVSYQSVYTLLVLAQLAGPMSAVSGNPIIHRAVTIAFCLPLAVTWLLSPPIRAHQEWVNASIAILIVVFAFYVLGHIKVRWAIFVESFYLRLRDEQQTKALELAVEKAEAASRAKTRFLASASHDLRQPLHTVALLTGVLKLQLQGKEQASAVNMLDKVVVSLGHQLDDLLDISKLDSGVMQVRPQVVDLRDYAQRLFEESKQSLMAKGLQPLLELPPDAKPVWVMADTTLLARALRNLLSNAQKFTAKGHVGLHLRLVGNKAMVDVQDSGIGIEQQNQAAVFSEFFQVNANQRERTEGLGLGLSIVKRISDLMGVEVSLQSTRGVGSCFTLSFDVLPSAGVAQVVDETTTTALERVQLNLKVLVVDDEAWVRESMALLLRELGCQVWLAASTVEARQACGNESPDVVISDYRLSEHDTGLTTLAEADKRWPKVHRVLITGDTAAAELQAFEQTGLRVLHKPVLAVELIAVLKQFSLGEKS